VVIHAIISQKSIDETSRFAASADFKR